MRFSLAAALVVFLPLPVSAQNQPTAVRARADLTPGVSQVFEHEQQVWNAVKGNDIESFNRLVDGLFTYVDHNGVVGWTPEFSAEALRDCTTSNFATEDVQTKQPATGIVILSYKASLDQTCKGVKSPSPFYVLSVWQRKGNSWKLIAHSETAAAPAQ